VFHLQKNLVVKKRHAYKSCGKKIVQKRVEMNE
jgi:hypothetical protein